VDEKLGASLKVGPTPVCDAIKRLALERPVVTYPHSLSTISTGATMLQGDDALAFCMSFPLSPRTVSCLPEAETFARRLRLPGRDAPAPKSHNRPDRASKLVTCSSTS
jgi:hypothetical protein